MPPKVKYETIQFSTFSGKKWEIDFDEPNLTSNSGILALLQSGIGPKLFDAMASGVSDFRQNPTHSVTQIISQRVSQIIAGYFDANDSKELQGDAVMLAASGKSTDEKLPSQPTISRFENSVTRKDLYRIAAAIMNHYLDSFCGQAPDVICMDMDPSAHLVHGQQELGLFNTHVGDTCLMPFYIFDGVNGRVMTAVLREGKTPTADEIICILKRLIKAIHQRFPETQILFRGDGHHTKPKVMTWLNTLPNVDFITGMPKNTVLGRLFGDDIEAAEARYARSVEEDGTFAKDVTTYASSFYKARSWDEEERIIARIIVSPKGTDVRYIVTSFHDASAQYLYQTVYCGRGEAELFIKECKLGLGSDTSPCSDAKANQCRLLLHIAAYAIMHRFRETVLKGTQWAKKTMLEIRLKLIKVAGRLEILKTKIKLHLPESLGESHREIWKRSREMALE